jgi:hypothetical protein
VSIGSEKTIDPTLLDALISIRKEGDEGYNKLLKLDDDRIEDVENWISTWEVKAETICQTISKGALNKLQSARNKKSPYGILGRGPLYTNKLHRLKFQVEALNEIIGQY